MFSESLGKKQQSVTMESTLEGGKMVVSNREMKLTMIKS